VIKTPHLDKLGEQSLRFTRFYVHSVCAPTRASLMTGRHFWRTGVSAVHAGKDFMNLDEVTIAEVLRGAGYRTGMWGKWHSGKTDGYYPWDRGFDEAYYATLYRHSSNTGLLNGKTHTLPGWTCSGLTDMAIEFIRKNKNRPFFAYVPYLIPHGLWDAPPDEVAAYRKRGLSKNFATLAGMITFMDKNVGRLMAALDEAGLRKNTIVIFMSDNGPTQHCGRGSTLAKLTDAEWRQRNTPLLLRGNKARVWENGIRSPLFVRWPAVAKPGVCNEPLSVMDVFPTLMEIAKAKLPEHGKALDGRSFAGLLADPAAAWPDRNVFVDNPDRGGAAVVTARYKYLEGRNEKTGLFDLTDDPRETRDLCKSQSAVAEKMRKASKAFHGNILKEGGAFRRPVFLIGHNGAASTFFWAYGAAQVEGGLKITNHALANFAGTKDKAFFDLVVETAGSYAVRIREKIPSGALFASTAGSTAPVYSGMPEDLSSCEGLSLPVGKVRLTLGMNKAAGQTFNLTRIYLDRLEK